MPEKTETAAKRIPPPDKDLLLLPDTNGSIDITVDTDEAGRRFDLVVSKRLAGCSRSAAAYMIRAGLIKLNDAAQKPGHRVACNDRITGTAPVLQRQSTPPTDPDDHAICPEPVELDIVYEDASLIVINKPPGLVVHPAPGHLSGTVAHGLRYRFPGIEGVGAPARPGIVHRIDKDTSGILVAAKTARSHEYLASLFKQRKIQKSYLAFVYGNPDGEAGQITYPIVRNKTDRKKMAALKKPDEIQAGGRNAETTWEVLERFDNISLLRLDIKTGRTHQIRVHCSAMGHPLVGDANYGFNRPLRAFKFKPEMIPLLKTVSRQMLHASKITFKHPETGIQMTFEAPLPHDMAWLHRSLLIFA